MPDDCCCIKYPDQFHYHYTLDGVLKRNNQTCELCDYKKDCCGRVCLK